MKKIVRLGDQPLDLTKQLDDALKAEQEADMFKEEGIYFVIREGKEIIRHRSYPCDIHKLDENQVKEMAYEFAHTIMKIKKRKQDNDAKEKDNKKEDS